MIDPVDELTAPSRPKSVKQGARRAARRPASPALADAWVEPQIDGGFVTRFGASIVDEFVAGHDASDVLRELVQNEFDGKGTKLTVDFGPDGLTVTGSGRTINAKGWERLSVILGTGRVVGAGDADGSPDSVEAKVNGIGSKNFGLRSLFLFGDRIYVRSGGRTAVLDLPTLGTQQLPDPFSKQKPGVTIYVPYRTKVFDRLQPFTIEAERGALDRIAGQLLATLVKLALPGKHGGIREFVLRSSRTGRRLFWRQSAAVIRPRTAGISIVKRTGRLVDEDPSRADPRVTKTVDELEFFRSVDIPAEHAGEDFADYFRESPSRLRVGVSLPLRKGRIDTTARGHFYYPLQTPHSWTGSAVNVSAPFNLDADRSQLRNTRWNTWLLGEAADLATALMSSDWLESFGADGFRVLKPGGIADPDGFASNVANHLSTAACWPTRAAGVNHLALAEDIVIPSVPALDGYLDTKRYLDDRLGGQADIKEMTINAGALSFTINSLIRLRCGPEDAPLQTKTGNDEAYYSYRTYTTSLSEVALQQKMARSIAAVSKNFSKANWADLKDTESTLAEDGSLARVTDLVVVDEAIWNVCPVPDSKRLNRALVGERSIASLAKPFDNDTWIIAAAARAADGAIDADERDALYRRVLADGENFNRRALAAVRRSPVVKDQRGNWVAPEDLLYLRRGSAGSFLAPVLRMPARELASRPKLIDKLRVRRELVGADLVAFGDAIEDHAALAPRFEALLNGVQSLLTPGTVAALRSQPFLMSKSGELSAPEDLHLDTAVNRSCLPPDRIVAGSNLGLYRRLKVRESASAEVLLAALADLRAQGEPPQRPELFYPELAKAAADERLARSALADTPILWTSGGYRAPRKVLAGATVQRLFEGAVPVVRGPEAIVRAYQQLGASAQPDDTHWSAFFRSVHDRFGTSGVHSVADQRMLLEAYRARSYTGLPNGLPEATLCLLDTQGLLFSRAELNAGRFVENDYPLLADELVRQRARIGFAVLGERSRGFFQTLRLKPLTAVCGPAKQTVGRPKAGPPWLRQAQEDMLALFKRPELARALQALANNQARITPGYIAPRLRDLSARLSRIVRIAFVEEAKREHRVFGVRALVEAETAILDDGIAIVRARSRSDFEQLVCQVLAEIMGAKDIAHARPLMSAIIPLTMCRTSGDMRVYLERMGIRLSDWGPIEGEEQPEQDDFEGVIRQVLDDFSDQVKKAPTQPTSSGQLTSTPTAIPTPPTPPKPFVLPDITGVSLEVKEARGDKIEPKRPGGGGGGGGGAGWAPTAEDNLRDRMVGERGEALVYRMELERVRGYGYERPEDHVHWTSRTQPGADHDIRSIDADGKPKWLEVKSTTGSDGQFVWSKNELMKAMRECERYELWRVYEASSTRPTAKCFANPAAMMSRSQITLELNSLRASIEAKF